MKEGDVVLTTFRQADGKTKNRPAIILRTIPPFDDFLVCGVSTQLRHRVADLDEIIATTDSDFAQSSLSSTSLIRVGFLAVLSEADLLGDIGSISTERHHRLLRRLVTFLQNPMSESSRAFSGSAGDQADSE